MEQKKSRSWLSHVWSTAFLQRCRKLSGKGPSCPKTVLERLDFFFFKVRELCSIAQFLLKNDKLVFLKIKTFTLQKTLFKEQKDDKHTEKQYLQLQPTYLSVDRTLSTQQLQTEHSSAVLKKQAKVLNFSQEDNHNKLWENVRCHYSLGS